MGENKDPSFMIWGQRDGHSKGVAEILLAYSKEEERTFQKNGCKVRSCPSLHMRYCWY
jgi:hypothetical protein